MSLSVKAQIILLTRLCNDLNSTCPCDALGGEKKKCPFQTGSKVKHCADIREDDWKLYFEEHSSINKIKLILDHLILMKIMMK